MSGGSSREVAEKVILEAEKFKVDVAAPQGNTIDLNAIIENEVHKQLTMKFNIPEGDVAIKRFFDNDDDFFHVTCHVDEVLKGKIRQGDFVELERLLPKDKTGGTLHNSEAKLMQWFTSDEGTLLAPAQDKSCKINGICKWEQAFRVYVAIYMEAHPTHAAELWQYVYTINSAALSYQWDNVALYDVTFRRLMA